MSQGRTLRQEFEHAHKLLELLKSSPNRPDSPEYQKLVAETLKSFNQCKEFVYKLSLFSDNESREDISTNDIKYLTVEYYMGMVTEKSQRLSRLDTIKLAIDYYFKFLKDLRNYGLLENVISKRIQETLSTGKITLGDVKSTNPATMRAEKIERFKKTKELQEKIKELSSSTDEEALREVEFTRLESFAVEAVSSLDMLNTELDMVVRFPTPGSATVDQHGEEARNDKRFELRGSEKGYTDKVEARLTNKNLPILSKTGKVNRPFTIVSTKRDQIQRRVMGTGQYLPTMSVEEYLEEEMKRGGIIQGGGPSSKQDDSSEDEDDEEKANQKTLKAREWDEFVEANPKGSGNTINRG